MTLATRNQVLRTALPPAAVRGGAPLDLDLDKTTERQVLALLLSRDFDPLVPASSRVGFCANPIRLVGRSGRPSTRTGALVRSYGSADEALGVTSPCAATAGRTSASPVPRLYAADTFHLIPRRDRRRQDRPRDPVANPLVFAHPTAPSFGPVHGSPNGGRCRPRRHRPPLPPRPPHRLYGPCTAKATHGGAAALPGLYSTRLPGGVAVVGAGSVAPVHHHLRRLLAQYLRHHRGRGGGGEPAVRQGRRVTSAARSTSTPWSAWTARRRSGVRWPGRGDSPIPGRPGRTGRDRGAFHRATGPRRRQPEGVYRGPDRLFTRAVRTSAPHRRPGPVADAGAGAGYLAKYATKSTGHRDQGQRPPAPAGGHRPAPSPAARSPSTRTGTRRMGCSASGRTPLGFRGHFATKSRRYPRSPSATLRRARQRAQARIAEANLRTGTPIDLRQPSRPSLLLADDHDETTVVIGPGLRRSAGQRRRDRPGRRRRSPRLEHAQERAQRRRALGSTGEGAMRSNRRPAADRPAEVRTSLTFERLWTIHDVSGLPRCAGRHAVLQWRTANSAHRPSAREAPSLRPNQGSRSSTSRRPDGLHREGPEERVLACSVARPVAPPTGRSPSVARSTPSGSWRTAGGDEPGPLPRPGGGQGAGSVTTPRCGRPGCRTSRSRRPSGTADRADSHRAAVGYLPAVVGRHLRRRGVGGEPQPGDCRHPRSGTSTGCSRSSWRSKTGGSRNPATGVRLPRQSGTSRGSRASPSLTALVHGVRCRGLAMCVLAFTGARFWETRIRPAGGAVDPRAAASSIAESASEVGGRLVWTTTKNHQRGSVPVPPGSSRAFARACEGKQPGDSSSRPHPAEGCPVGQLAHPGLRSRLCRCRHRRPDPARPAAHGGLAGHRRRGQRQGGSGCWGTSSAMTSTSTPACSATTWTRWRPCSIPMRHVAPQRRDQGVPGRPQRRRSRAA